MGSCDLAKQRAYYGYANGLYTHIQEDEPEPLVLVVSSASGDFNASAGAARQPSLGEQASLRGLSISVPMPLTMAGLSSQIDSHGEHRACASLAGWRLKSESEPAYFCNCAPGWDSMC